MSQQKLKINFELYPIEGYEEANSTLNRRLEAEIEAAASRRLAGKEFLNQSAWTIRDNLLNEMLKYKKYGARDSDPELILVNSICSALELPPGSLTKFHGDRSELRYKK